MKKQHKIFDRIIIILIIIFLFPHSITYAEDYPEEVQGSDGNTYQYTTGDDGSDGPEVNTVLFELTGYTGEQLGSGYTYDQFTQNSTYGWSELEIDGEKYVVIAAATHEMLKANHGRTGEYWFYGAKFSHIHYFSYEETIQFKFEDEGFDSNVYNGIILDSGDAMMFPQHEKYKRDPGINMFDIFFGQSASDENIGKISGKKVLATKNGVFSSKGGTSSSSSKRNLFLDFIAAIFTIPADAINFLINGLSTVTYSRSEIEADESLNEEIQVADAGEEIETNAIKTIDVSSTIDNEEGNKETVFTTNTEIPVITNDFYGLSINKVDLLDIDFLSTSNENSNKGWNFIRGIVSLVSHIALYMGAALLITMLIWRSILFVKSAMGDSPDGAAESKKIMDNLVKAIVLIGLIYFIMALCMYFYHYVLNLILNGKEVSNLIRVNVENVYSFNTNHVGYFKYMTLQTNSFSALKYAIFYAIETIVSGIWFVFMISRMLIIGGLTIIAPLTATMTMSERSLKKGFSLTNLLHFNNWLMTYLMLLWVPLVVVIVYKIVLYIP